MVTSDEVIAVMEKLIAMETTLSKIVTLLEALLTPAPASTPGPPMPIATYEQMYGAIEAAAPLDVAPATPLPTRAPSRRIRRWFLREEPV